VTPRSAPRGKSYGLVESAGKVAVVGGFAMASGNGNSAGRAIVRAVRGEYASVGDAARDIAYNIKESIPLVGKDPNFKDNRAMIGGGTAATVLGPALRKVPLVGKIARWGFRLDKKVRVRIA